ncbi:MULTISPECIES: CHAT domain-containing protein [Cyanophyceae]|uniref:CHAT domain-containing protein n=1 Tax=Cyanophyceae TaxID=3028117 RepID=UPI001688FDBF|nr:CHAT domain-containing protein [Trichocoleus sp. FACHB-40]MBD2005191.1 CHAT domain-containing protein [Trichocoleus sp. FACHB-40]
MKLLAKRIKWLLVILPFVGVIRIKQAIAQPIVPATDGTGTIVNVTGDRLDISGGKLSGQGDNLFHSFNQFDLNSAQTANFLTNQNIQNILGRVVGGDASKINGLIQVIGGNSNLYLMNPAGIIFGNNARLNVPASFTATTATSIGFGNNNWLNAIGNNNYADLSGTPSLFNLSATQASAIVNSGDLAVGQNQNLTLLSGVVVNTGRLAAPGGNITVAAVPGGLVRIAQPGNLLSIEVPATQKAADSSLAQMLTGGDISNATGVKVNSNGQVVLAGSGIGIPADPGTAIVSGSADVQGDTGGKVQVLGDKVGLVGANINASGNSGGGTVLIGGDYQGKGTVPNASRTYVSKDSAINADSKINGNGGRVIVWADDATEFHGNISARGGSNSGDGGFVEVSGKQGLSFAGKVDTSADKGSAGTLLLDPVNIRVTDQSAGPGAQDAQLADGQILFNDTPPADFIISETALEQAVNFGDVILQATNNITIDNLTTDGVLEFGFGQATSITFLADADLDGVGSFVMNPANAINTNGANLSITGASLTLGNIATDGGDLQLTSRNGAIATGAINTAPFYDSFGGSVLINATNGNILIDDVITRGGVISITNNNGGIETGILDSTTGFEDAPITITATNGDITTDDIQGGPISIINNSGAITTGTLDTSGFYGNPGNVLLNATSGNITTDDIITSGSPGNGGDVIINATNSNILTGNITAFGGNGDGGNVNIDATNGNILTGNITTSGDRDTSGEVSLTATGNTATGNIETGAIDTSITGFDITGGAVTLDAGNNVRFTTINTQATDVDGGDTIGGDVIITASGVVQGTGLLNSGATIQTQGFSQFAPDSAQGGSVAIQHNGGRDNFRFIVGDAANNGTAGSIDTGGSIGNGQIISPTQTIPNVNTLIPNDNTFDVGDPTVNGIRITFINQAPTITANSLLPDVQQNQSITFTLADLTTGVNDTNNDFTSVRLDAINGGTLTRQDGTPIVPGTVLSVNDVLVYTPPAGVIGQINALTISASDRVSFSAPLQLSINVSPPPPVPTPPPPTPIPTPPPPTPIPTPPPTPLPTPLPTPRRLSRDLSPPQEQPLTQLQPIIRLVSVEIDPFFAQVDQGFTLQFQQYLGAIADTQLASLDEAREITAEIEEATGIKPALVYVTFVPQAVATTGPENPLSQDSDQLEILIVTAKKPPIRRRIAGATRGQVLKLAQEFRGELTKPMRTRDYLKSGQQLYEWLIAPLEGDLSDRKINNLVFLMDAGLRSLPVAALHDGKGFLIEKYSVGLMPSLSLTDTRYRDIKNSQVLAMGAAKFTTQNPLPAVPAELSIIADTLWSGKFFLNEAFTLNNLKAQRQKQPFGIVHLGTHAEFKPGAPSNSYIQLWDTQLRLDQMRQLGWNDPPVELLVLSACRTALGDEQAELGFAGLAVQAGVKSALASLWYVSDEGTLGLMSNFYEELKKAPIKAEALRRTQLAMLKGQVRLEGGQIRTSNGYFPLPTSLVSRGDENFEHPYYWAAFTMIGNPW